MKVIITGPPLVPQAMEEFRLSGAQVQAMPPYSDPGEFSTQVDDMQFDAVIVRTGRFTGDLIEASPELKVIAKHGVGVDNIDLKAATEKGIPVLIGAGASVQSVAEHTLAMILALMKNLLIQNERVRKGHWDKSTYNGIEFAGKHLGLVGYGHVARRLARLVKPFSVTITVYDPYLAEDKRLDGVQQVMCLNELLSVVDVVSLHCPLTDETRNIIGTEAFNLMKPTALLINTARGGLIDEAALLRALQKEQIMGAGLDTFGNEPTHADNPLWESSRLVVTPHVAGITGESNHRMGMKTVDNVLRFLRDGSYDLVCLANPEVLPRRQES